MEGEHFMAFFFDVMLVSDTDFCAASLDICRVPLTSQLYVVKIYLQQKIYMDAVFGDENINFADTERITAAAAGIPADGRPSGVHQGEEEASVYCSFTSLKKLEVEG